MAIFQCEPSSGEERSRTDFSHPVNIQNDWDLIGEILDGESDTDEDPYVEITVEEDELGWNVYYSGSRGLYSSKFVNTIGESSFSAWCHSQLMSMEKNTGISGAKERSIVWTGRKRNTQLLQLNPNER